MIRISVTAFLHSLAIERLEVVYTDSSPEAEVAFEVESKSLASRAVSQCSPPPPLLYDGESSLLQAWLGCSCPLHTNTGERVC